MKSIIAIPLLLLVSLTHTSAQADPSADRYFPSPSEFKELHNISSETIFDDPERLSKLPNGKIISDVGFHHYAQRTYSLEGSKFLSIEVITLMDLKAAYSLLTLLRSSNIQSGAPGDEYSLDADGLQFAQRNQWINIRGRDVSKEFIKQVANSVSRRLGPLQKKIPALISHFPKSGYDASSLKYFPGFKSFESYAKKLPAWIQSCGQDMEIAQAKYSVGNQTGVLSLLSFPTSQIGEGCHSKLAASHAGKIQLKNSGPIVGVLEGPVDPDLSRKLLDSIQYRYSVQWIYEKKESKPTNLFGIPIRVVEKLVKKSFIFVGLTAVISIIAGLMFAFFRFRFRNRMSKSNLDDTVTHLRMR